MPAQQVRPGVPQALPRQRHRYAVLSLTVVEYNLTFIPLLLLLSGVVGWDGPPDDVPSVIGDAGPLPPGSIANVPYDGYTVF